MHAALCTWQTLSQQSGSTSQLPLQSIMSMQSHIREVQASKFKCMHQYINVAPIHRSDLHLRVHKHCIIQTCSYTVCLFRQQQL